MVLLPLLSFMGKIKTSAMQPVSQEASNYDEYFMQQSLLFDDSLKMVYRLVAVSRRTVKEIGRPSALDDSHLMVDRLVTLKGKGKELQIQEALYSSAISSTSRVINQEEEDDEDEQKEIGEESSFQMYCTICMEAKPAEEMFLNQSCFHNFCDECIRSHVAAKIQENISLIKCPDSECGGVLEPHQCRSIIPDDVFDRWNNALCENSVAVSQRFYCPFKNCSAMLVKDKGEEVLTSSNCPHCNRLFCARCKVPWHAGMDCKRFQISQREKEDQMVMRLAMTKNWGRCPKCRYYVEKIEGCSRISCRCGCEFCYHCGSPWSNLHYKCYPGSTTRPDYPAAARRTNRKFAFIKPKFKKPSWLKNIF